MKIPHRDRLPIVLIVNPTAESRFTMWRLLSGDFGVLEAASALAACDWLVSRQDIDALVVQGLPEVDDRDFVSVAVKARPRLAGRVIVVAPYDDARHTADTVRGWFFNHEHLPATASTREASSRAS
jgi:hypothetical protein